MHPFSIGSGAGNYLGFLSTRDSERSRHRCVFVGTALQESHSHQEADIQ